MGNQNRHRLLALMACWAMLAVSSSAQDTEDPVTKARWHFGPLGVTPSIALRNLGVDSNVFNEVTEPKRDFTFALVPQANLWSRAGRARLAGDGRVEMVYFQRYSSERSLDGNAGGRIELALNRVMPWAAARYFRGRQRVGYEIDLRARRVTDDVSFGADVGVASKTRIGVALRRSTTAFEGDALFLGTSLRESLDRSSDSVTAHYSQRLTPLTSFVVEVDAIRDRFDYSPGRDADSVRVQAGFNLAPSALISGQARLGYRKFDPLGGAVKGNRGITANVTAGATVANRARLDLSVQRDVNYSFEPIYPYYVLTGALATLTPRLTDHWDVQARLGTQRLAYNGFEASEALPDRVDRVVSVGGGIGYRIGRDVRFGVNLDRDSRQSPVQIRDYTGYRIGSTVTYGR